MKQILERLQQPFNPDAIAAWVATVLPRAVTAVLIFAVFFLAWKGLERGLGLVRRIFLDLVGGDERFMGDPPPEMVVSALNDYNVAVQLRVWLDDEKDHLAARIALREKIYAAMRAAGVEMPFETFQLAPGELGQLTVRRAGAGEERP